MVFALVLVGVVWVRGICAFASEDCAACEEKRKAHNLTECSDAVFGIQLACNPAWGLYTGEKAFVIVISSDPAVTMTVARTESPYVSVEQLTDSLLKKMGRYHDGFAVERIHVAGQKAFMVKGFDVDSPQLRLLDYYFIRSGNLYRILFTVDPKERWDDYKFLFKAIIESVRLIEEPGRATVASKN